MMGQDQDDIVLAPWTAIKFRVNAGGAGSTIGASQTITVSVNSLSNLYPGGTTRYPVALAAQAADIAAADPLRQRRHADGQGDQRRADPRGHRADHRAAPRTPPPCRPTAATISKSAT